MEVEEQPILTSNSIASSDDIKSNGHSVTEEIIEGNDKKQIHLFWRNLSYRIKQIEYKCVNGVPYKFVRRKKTLINNLCGNFVSGKLTAILGPNGAGKSTLLNCLAGRRRQGLSGQMFVILNGCVNYLVILKLY